MHEKPSIPAEFIFRQRPDCRRRVKAHLAPENEWIRQHTVYAQYADSDAPPIDFLKIVDPRSGEKPGASGLPRLLAEHLAHSLRDIHDHPQDALRFRYQRLGWGAGKGQRHLAELRAAGCINQTTVPSTSRHGGAPRVLVALSQRGREFLDAYERTAPSA